MRGIVELEEIRRMETGDDHDHININKILKIGTRKEVEKVEIKTKIKEIKEFNIGIILEKVIALEEKVGGFKDKKFQKLVKGFKKINQKLIFLKNLEDEILQYA